jgi:hypothetical protein
MKFTPTLLGLLGLVNLGVAAPSTENGDTTGAGLVISGKLPYPLEPFTFKGTIGDHEVSSTYLIASPPSSDVMLTSSFQGRYLRIH